MVVSAARTAESGGCGFGTRVPARVDGTGISRSGAWECQRKTAEDRTTTDSSARPGGLANGGNHIPRAAGGNGNAAGSGSMLVRRTTSRARSASLSVVVNADVEGCRRPGDVSGCLEATEVGPRFIIVCRRRPGGLTAVIGLSLGKFWGKRRR